MKKHIINLNCKNSEMLRKAFNYINHLTESGAKRFKHEGKWNGRNYEQASFIAKQDEVEKIKSEIENHFGVKFN